MRHTASRLLIVVGAIMLLDSLFYAVVTPLLPELSHQLHLSKLSAGVLTAAYPAGVVVMALPSGVLALRRGPRFTVLVGLALLVISTVGFGVLNTAAGLDIARVVEGIGGACAWAGGLAWIVAATAPERRGAVLGAAVSAALVGSLFGPAVGALASVTGRPLLFSALAAASVLLVIPVLATVDQREDIVAPLSSVIRVLVRQPLLGVMLVSMVPAIITGSYEVLGPLRLHHLGAGAGVIGLTFLLSGGVQAAVSPLAGRASDRYGRTAPLRASLLALPVALVCFTLPGSALVLACLIVATVAVVALFWAPAMALITDVAESQGVGQAHTAGLINLGWASGQLTGAVGGGAAAKALGDSGATFVIAAVCLVTLVWLVRARRSLTPPRRSPVG